MQDFRKIIDEFIEIAGRIVNDVKHEKARAIAAQNQLKSMAEQRDIQQQDIQVKKNRCTLFGCRATKERYT